MTKQQQMEYALAKRLVKANERIADALESLLEIHAQKQPEINIEVSTIE